MAAVATSLRPMCSAICSKLSFFLALAANRVAAEAGRLGCCEVCIVSFHVHWRLGEIRLFLHREWLETLCMDVEVNGKRVLFQFEDLLKGRRESGINLGHNI